MRLYSPRIIDTRARADHVQGVNIPARTHAHPAMQMCNACVCASDFFFGFYKTRFVRAAWTPVGRQHITCTRSTLYSKTHLSDFMAPFKWLLNLPNVEFCGSFPRSLSLCLSRGVSHKFGLTRCRLKSFEHVAPAAAIVCIRMCMGVCLCVGVCVCVCDCFSWNALICNK